jgi:hypothetical protein
MLPPTIKIPAEYQRELPVVLDKLVTDAQSALNENFLGAYLVGSLATGDFDLDSDIDFLIVTNEELTDPEVARIQSLHIEIHGLGSYSARHLEGSYLSKDTLTQPDLVGVQPLWYVDDDSALLERSVHDNQWHVRWILRERAIILAGPDPKTLLPQVPIEALRNEMQSSVETLRAHFIAELDKPLGWFNTRFGQSFTVLTCCRILHTQKTGTVDSKLAAVRWAEQSLQKEWQDLIRQAWTERGGVRFGVKVRQLADSKLLQETARFIAYVQLQLNNQR